jgi:hypothetical protein
MATPTPTVKIGFIGPAFNNAFTLDSATNGRLDNTDYALGGAEVLVDLTSRTTSLRVKRGRKDFTQPFRTGTATLILRNIDGELDPLNTSSTYWPGINVGRTVTIDCNGESIYNGTVTNIELGYTVSGDAWVVVRAADGLGDLATREIQANTAFTAQKSGQRVTAVLTNAGVNYQGTSAINAGLSDLAAETLSSATNARSYLRKVINSEQGYLYGNRSGVLTFENRYGPLADTNKATFSDDGSNIAYQRIDRRVATTELFNQLSANRTSQDPVLVNNTSSQDSYGIRNLNVGEVLVLDDSTVTDLLDLLLVKTASTETRIAEITAVLDTLSGSDITAIAQLELVDKVTVEFTPPGTSQQIAASSIESIEHNFSFGTTWRCTLGLIPQIVTSYLVLDNATLGQLDNNSLGF